MREAAGGLVRAVCVAWGGRPGSHSRSGAARRGEPPKLAAWLWPKATDGEKSRAARARRLSLGQPVDGFLFRAVRGRAPSIRGRARRAGAAAKRPMPNVFNQLVGVGAQLAGAGHGAGLAARKARIAAGERPERGDGRGSVIATSWPEPLLSTVARQARLSGGGNGGLFAVSKPLPKGKTQEAPRRRGSRRGQAGEGGGSSGHAAQAGGGDRRGRPSRRGCWRRSRPPMRRAAGGSGAPWLRRCCARIWGWASRSSQPATGEAAVRGGAEAGQRCVEAMGRVRGGHGGAPGDARVNS